MWNSPGVGKPATGDITFLFSDIEGSTRLWQAHPDRMPDVLARHDALARSAVGDHGGELFKHTGDGVCAAFDDARAAVDAAVAFQRALADASWGDGPHLRVRIALDSGPAQRRSGDYFGPTLNRTARVLAAGFGGQILATGATMALAPAVEHVDLGLHRLRDLGEPVHLLQVCAAGLERTFPPLRTLERFRHSLPVVHSSFVGRDNEITRVRRLLASSQMLTVTGVGGCGKTRLTLAVVAQELERFPDGVFFVDLAAVADQALVWSAIADTLGLIAGELAPREIVLARLRGTTTLLVLDNCEHLLDACADVATALVDLPGSVVLVATSREPLGIEGEQVYRVPSLGLPTDDTDATSAEAVRLFVERATAVDATFTMTPGITSIVVDICRRLDGIPLAFELAAARVRHLSPAEIARRLDQRFRLLTSGPRAARQRQQTLAAALDWSFQLLTERERTLLRRCAVFVDGFSLEAAEGVCADEALSAADVVDVLGALVDKSLVSLHAMEGRYRLLETIRLYALDRLLEADEVPPLRTRHLGWFERTYDTIETTPMARLDVENLRAARAWAHEIGDGERVARLTRELFWQSRTYEASVLEERAWCRTVLAYETLPRALRAEALAIASFRDVGVGDWNAAIEHARDAIALALEPGEGYVGAAYAPLAIALMVTDPEAAERVIDEGIERRRHARSPAFPAAMLASLRMGTALMRGDARSVVERGRLVADAPGFMTDGVAFALHLLGDHDGAEAEARGQSLDGPRSSGMGEHSRHLLYALTAAARGQWETTGRELAVAAAIVRRYRYPLTLNDCVVACGAIAALEGRFERACILLAAVADRASVRSPHAWAVYLHYRAIVRAALDPATVRRCRDAARAVDLDRALDEELARFGAQA